LIRFDEEPRWKDCGFRVAHWIAAAHSRSTKAAARRFYVILMTTIPLTHIQPYYDVILDAFKKVGLLTFLKTADVCVRDPGKVARYILTFKDVQGKILFERNFYSLKEIELTTGCNISKINIKAINNTVSNGKITGLQECGIWVGGKAIARS
tara:strand:+ start:2523 stop:2978 length:456 start_codon:yes stop_codon:yes gene_type:complete